MPLTGLVVALAAGVLVLDLASPPVFAVSVLYGLVVLLSLRSPKHDYPFITATACTLLAVAGFLFHAVSGLVLPPLVNSLLAQLAIWAPAVLGARYRQVERTLRAARDDLEQAARERLEAEEQENKSLRAEIARRKRTERALREAQTQYMTLVKNLPVHVIRKDLKGRFVFVSDSFCRLLGKSEKQIIDKTDADLFPKELAEKYRADDAAVLERGEVFEDVEEHLGGDGSTMYVHVMKSPVHDAAGNVTGLLVIFWDVTENKINEQTLREGDLRKRAMFDAAMDCIIIIDGDGRIREFNQAAEKTFGYRPDEVVGADIVQTIVPEGYRQRYRRNIVDYGGAGRKGSLMTSREEMPHQRKNGEQFMAEVALQPIPLDGDVAMAVFLRDITDRIKFQQAMLQAKQAAEEASEAKSMFLANMGHEIRTPLNAVIGMADVLLGTPLNIEQREFLLILQESGESLLGVINDLLDFSKIEAGKLDLEEVDFDLRERLGDAVKSMAFRAHGKGLELACRVRREVPRRVRGDPTRLRQIIVNLIGNAVKFTETGEIVVDVGRHSQSEKTVLLHFTVRDTGIGIPAEKQKDIFTAFEQADKSTTRRFGGTGLGLAICAKLAGRMGGRIWVESEEGRGSAFHFTAKLRLAKSDGEAKGAGMQAAALRGKSVLVVDDNESSRGILEELLNAWGLSSEMAADADQASALAHQARQAGWPFHLLLIDAEMPGANGFALAESLRADAPSGSNADDGQRESIVMLLNSGGNVGQVARCEQLERAAYVMKPIKSSELFETLLAVVTGDFTAARRDDVEQGPRVKPLKILLAEDTLANQKLAMALLARHGHQVALAVSGQEAVAMALGQPFDLVLMDVQMPDMDGLEATAAIRTQEAEGRHVPIVAMTARAMKEDRQICLDAGMDDYLCKPIRARDLYAAIARVSGAEAVEDVESPARRPHVAAAETVDWDEAMEFVEGDRDLLREIVKAALDEHPEMMRQLKECVSSGDSKGVCNAAHAVKGYIRYFGHTRAFEHAFQLETMGDQENLAEAAEIFAKLEEEIQQLAAALAAYLQADNDK